MRANKDYEDIIFSYKQPYDSADGPQVEGLMPDEVLAAVHDEQSVWLDTNRGRLPLFTPIGNNGEYNAEYFARFSDEGMPAYYCANKLLEGVDVEECSMALRKLIARRALIVTDYEKSDSSGIARLESMLARHALDYMKHEFVDSRNESAASVPHYAGKVTVKKNDEWRRSPPAKSTSEAYERIRARDPKRHNYQDGVGLVSGERMDDVFIKSAWDMYHAQFTRLIAENPSMQEQTKDDFERTMRSDGSVVIASFDEGKPVSMGYFVGDVNNVYWLRSGFYEERYLGEVVWYFPGIVTKLGFERKARATSIADLGTKIAYEQHIEPLVTFQCTNVSNDYIPPFFKAAIENTGLYSVDFDKIAEYKYVGYSFPGAGSIE